MRTIFLDTVGLIALWNRSDQWHAAARARYDQLNAEAVDFVTTTYVLLECGNEASRRPYRQAVVTVREEMGMAGELFEPTIGDLQLAWEAYARGEAGDAGIVDQISFAFMRCLGLTEAFTTDRHFQAAGFVTLF